MRIILWRGNGYGAFVHNLCFEYAKMQGLIQNMAFLVINMVILTQFQIFHPSGRAGHIVMKHEVAITTSYKILHKLNNVIHSPIFCICVTSYYWYLLHAIIMASDSSW